MSLLAKVKLDRAPLLGVSVFLVCTLALGVASWRARPSPPAPAALDLPTRERMFRELVRQEPAMRQRSRGGFPGDRWSQGDDFANQELRAVRRIAARYGVRLADVFAVIDEGLHAGWAPTLPRDAHVAPCKPRPFYD